MKILLTGATGFLGTELYSRLRAAGHEVWGLSRHGPDLVGDITKWHFGLRTLPQVDLLLHCAAVITLSPSHAELVNVVNTRATLSIINYCLERGPGGRPQVPHLAYISTAYVCGDWRGEWDEGDLHNDQGFKNPYEESKYLAEAYIRQFSLRTFGPTIRSSVFRPGIIVGRSADGKATAFDGFYRPVQAIGRISQFFEEKLKFPPRERVEKALHLPPLPVPLTMRGDPDSTLNLVPVDWVAQMIIDNLGHGDQHRTFHLTNPDPPTNQQIIDWICQILGVTGIKWNPRTRLLQPHDRIYARMTRDFTPYVEFEPRFISTVNSDLGSWVKNERMILQALSYWRNAEGGYDSVSETGGEVRTPAPR